jgi:hypothetical protein
MYQQYSTREFKAAHPLLARTLLPLTNPSALSTSSKETLEIGAEKA